MTYSDGEINPRSEEEWLDLMLQQGADYWGEDITDREGTAIHHLYRPFAGRLAELERQLQTVLQSLRIKEATGSDLDFLGERYGIFRRDPQRARGTVEFTRSSSATKDYLIQKGTVVRTSGAKVLEFETTESVTLTEGSTSIRADIEAVEPGAEYNVAAGSIDNVAVLPEGVEQVVNNYPTTSGRDKEDDDEYRARILNSLRNIKSASGWEIYNGLLSKDYIRDVLYVDKNSDLETPNLSPGDIEVTVDTEPGHTDEISQSIFENMPMGANPVGGYRGEKEVGTASLPNGQTFSIPFSKPTQLDIYIDGVVTTTGDVNKDKIINNVVQYIGGSLTSEEGVSGRLSMGEDVIYGAVDYAIRDVNKVHDISELYVGTSSSPTGTSNISVAPSESPITAASDINITLQ